MNDFLKLQALQQQRQCQQQQQQQQRMFPPLGRRASLLACMDEDGKIDPVRYIQYSKMKRANFLYHMNKLFPGGPAAIGLLPRNNNSSTLGMDSMSVLGMNQSMCHPLTSTSVSRNSSMLMGLPDLPFSVPLRSPMDFASTGVLPAQSTQGMFEKNKAPVISATSSYASSPSLKPHGMASPSLKAAAAVTQQQPNRQLRQDEYEAAEALLFGMGRACDNNKNGKSLLPIEEDVDKAALYEEEDGPIGKKGTSPKKTKSSKRSLIKKQYKSKGLPITKKKIPKKSRKKITEKAKNK